jgi:hypothetical protein
MIILNKLHIYFYDLKYMYMKNELEKMEEYLPYKIFQKNEDNKKVYLNKYNSTKKNPKKVKTTIAICKNLKSVTKSTNIYSNYIGSYTLFTQDYCFKTPANSVYPLRKNIRYLSHASLQDLKMKSKLSIKKNRRPLSAFISSDKELISKKIKLKKNPIYRNDKNQLNNNKYFLSEQFSKSIDLDNNENIKTKNFEFIVKYVTKMEYKKINDINNNFNKTKLSCKSILKFENLKYELSIFSICLRFRLLNNNNNNNKTIYQKLYIPFKYLPFFYLLDYQTFKVFLSEIIFYENNLFCLNNNDYIYQICDKYSKYISSYINNTNNKKEEITFFKNEFIFQPFYYWFIYDKNINEKNRYKIFELKIEFPILKLNFYEKEVIIKNILKKNLLIRLMENNLKSWEKTSLFELFYIKKIRNIIVSLIKSDSSIKKQKIDIFPFYILKNQNIEKKFQFFISDLNKKISKYYIFNPYKILAWEKRKKNHQEIQLNLKESQILHKLKNIWGTANTLSKCMYTEKIKVKEDDDENCDSDYDEYETKVSFMFNRFYDLKNDYFEKNIKYKNVDDQNILKIDKLNIELINCSLKRYIINEDKFEEKLIELNQEIINMILEGKKGIYEKTAEFCEDILKEKEFNIKWNYTKKRNLIEENEKNSEINNNNKISLNKKSSTINIDMNKKIINIEKKKDKNDNKTSNNTINNRRRVFSAKVSNRGIKNKMDENVNDNLFVTKNLGKNIVKDIYPSESESNEESNISKAYKYIKSFSNKQLNMIHNQKDLNQNRLMGNSYLFKNEFNLNKIRRIVSAIHRKKDEENIHNKFY